MQRKTRLLCVGLVLALAGVGAVQWSLTPHSTPLFEKKISLQASTEEFAIRGIIEGFYGAPWTHEQRLDLLAFMREHQYNTYVYAPKDDPYQRRQWSELYPTAPLEEMRSLVQAATVNDIHFVYSISPGIPAPLPAEKATPEWITNSITISSETDQKRLLSKLDQLRSLGIHEFLLSFDDVQEKLKPEDRDVYGKNMAQAHVDLANKVYQQERRQDPDFQLWLAPTHYYGLSDSLYWQTIRTSLDPQIPVIWTGEWVLNKSITSEQADQVTKLLGRKPLLWDNYPVNDYTYALKQRPQLLMGPIENRSPDLGAHLSGYLTNPMNQPQASKVALATIGDYLKTPRTYDPNTAWEHAVKSLEGLANPDDLLLFSRYAQESTLRPQGNPDFAQLAKAYWQDGDPTALRREFQALADLPARLHTRSTDPALLADIDGWLTKLGQEGQTGLLALDYLQTSSHDPQHAQKGMQLFSQVRHLSANELKIGEEIVKFLQRACQ